MCFVTSLKAEKLRYHFTVTYTSRETDKTKKEV